MKATSCLLCTKHHLEAKKSKTNQHLSKPKFHLMKGFPNKCYQQSKQVLRIKNILHQQ
ncbi:hypothetical protein HI914_05973 [Erysiphe necator]|nr:hypothetical protein HI914_05973 [Erysiphe necator]